MIPDCLGFTLAETRKLLAADGWQVADYFFTGPCDVVSAQEERVRVIRLSLVEANQLRLVLADVDTTIPPVKGGVRTNAP